MTTKIYRIVKYTITPEIIENARVRANERVRKGYAMALGERLNKTNTSGYGGERCLHGYMGEEIIFQIDPEAMPANNMAGKVDYTKNGCYIDVKTMKTGALVQDIVERKYCAYILCDQVLGAVAFCDEQGIDYAAYWYEIAYWDGSSNTFIRATNSNLRLDNILQMQPIAENPPHTDGTSEVLLQFKIPMADHVNGVVNIKPVVICEDSENIA